MCLKRYRQRRRGNVVGVTGLHADMQRFKGSDSVKLTIHGAAELYTNIPSIRGKAVSKGGTLQAIRVANERTEKPPKHVPFSG